MRRTSRPPATSRVDLVGRLLFRWRLVVVAAPRTAQTDAFWVPGSGVEVPGDLPSDEVTDRLAPGDTVKLVFERRWPIRTERMWVRLEEVDGEHLVGRLDNVPFYLRRPRYGDRVVLTREHVLEVDPGPTAGGRNDQGGAGGDVAQAG
ncbi:hypothetical protein ACGIF2_05725 [Cellulomonas sp. P22]|uniref:hypothetical protein n=1 Tax=Cellulomonas sp. P22 TaxID=3373189 RepID=UPI003789B2EC